MARTREREKRKSKMPRRCACVRVSVCVMGSSMGSVTVRVPLFLPRLRVPPSPLRRPLRFVAFRAARRSRDDDNDDGAYHSQPILTHQLHKRSCWLDHCRITRSTVTENRRPLSQSQRRRRHCGSLLRDLHAPPAAVANGKPFGGGQRCITVRHDTRHTPVHWDSECGRSKWEWQQLSQPPATAATRTTATAPVGVGAAQAWRSFSRKQARDHAAQ